MDEDDFVLLDSVEVSAEDTKQEQEQEECHNETGGDLLEDPQGLNMPDLQFEIGGELGDDIKEEEVNANGDTKLKKSSESSGEECVLVEEFKVKEEPVDVIKGTEEAVGENDEIKKEITCNEVQESENDEESKVELINIKQEYAT